MTPETFTLKTVTPIFSYGANDTPEIRPSAIKGQLRYWFRAMMGGVFQRDRELVKKLEDSVFGSTDGKSSFTLRIKNNGLNVKHASSNSRISEVENKSGVLYLGYNLFRTRRGETSLERNKNVYWPDKSDNFEIEFSFRNNSVREIVWGAMWMFENLGGIGQRTRRGYGGIRIVKTPESYRYNWNKTDAEDFNKALSKIAENYCADAVKIPLKEELDSSPKKEHIFSSSNNKPDFSCFFKWRLVYCRNDNWTTWIEALDKAGMLLRGFREDKSTKKLRFGYYTYDYKTVVSDFFDDTLKNPGIVQDFRNDAFGLPIQYFSSSRSDRNSFREVKASLEAEQKLNNKTESIDRRASPLFIRPVYIADDKYGLIFLFFDATFLPNNAAEILIPKTKNWEPKGRKLKSIKVKPADLSLIDSFMNKLETDKNINCGSIGNITRGKP